MIMIQGGGGILTDKFNNSIYWSTNTAMVRWFVEYRKSRPVRKIAGVVYLRSESKQWAIPELEKNAYQVIGDDIERTERLLHSLGALS